MSVLGIFIVIAFASLILSLASLSANAKKMRWMVIWGVIALGATIVATIIFGWWFALFGAIVFIITFAFWIIDPEQRWLKMLVGILLIGIVALGAIFLSPFATFETRNLPTQNGGGTNPKSSAPCADAIIVASQTHGGKVEADLNDGDPFDFSLTLINPDFPSGDKTLVVLTEPGHIFDVVYPTMYFTSIRLRGTPEQALCSATKFGGSALAYVYVGAAETPQGWSTVETDGWWTELVAKEYSEAAITPGGEWSAFQIAGNDKNREILATATTYGQLWNPAAGGVVVHFQIEKGYSLSVPANWQGTYWTVVGGNPTLIQDRFIQATGEVVERDAPLSIANVTLLYCGATLPDNKLVVGEKSTPWIASLDGWKCETK